MQYLQIERRLGLERDQAHRRPGCRLGDRLRASWGRFRDSRAFWPVVGAAGGALTVGAVTAGVGASQSGLSPAEQAVLLGISR